MLNGAFPDNDFFFPFSFPFFSPSLALPPSGPWRIRELYRAEGSPLAKNGVSALFPFFFFSSPPLPFFFLFLLIGFEGYRPPQSDRDC